MQSLIEHFTNPTGTDLVMMAFFLFIILYLMVVGREIPSKKQQKKRRSLLHTKRRTFTEKLIACVSGLVVLVICLSAFI